MEQTRLIDRGPVSRMEVFSTADVDSRMEHQHTSALPFDLRLRLYCMYQEQSPLEAADFETATQTLIGNHSLGCNPSRFLAPGAHHPKCQETKHPSQQWVNR